MTHWTNAWSADGATTLMNRIGPPRRIAAVWAAGALLLVAACGEDPDTDPPATDPDPVEEGTPAEPLPEMQAVYERSLVFVSDDPDSTVVVPWSFRSLSSEEVELRERGVWRVDGGGWEALAMEADTGQALGPAWRILPGPAVRLVVGAGDALETLILRRDGDELEVSPGALLAEWTRPPREAVRVHRGTAILPPDSLDGFVADLSLPLGSATPPDGDWIFVHGGEGIQAVLVQQPGGDAEIGFRYRGWFRTGDGEETWSGIQVRWDEVRAFEPARRDVPVRWLLHLEPLDDEDPPRVSGDLEAVNWHLEPGVGEGPVLPVEGFFRLAGVLVLRGDSLPVAGVIRHRQP